MFLGYKRLSMGESLVKCRYASVTYAFGPFISICNSKMFSCIGHYDSLLKITENYSAYPKSSI